AQWATFDAVAESGIWAQIGKMIAAEIKDTLLQIAKNTIVFAMQRVIFAKIAGANGVPGFIQNWALSAANAFQQSALSALNKQMVCVGTAPFAPQLRVALNATYNTNGSNNVCAVQFNAQLANNLSSFYNNFESGGWVMYGQTLQ